MANEIFLPRFEQAESTILQRMVDALKAKNWHAEPGDFMHDAVSAVPLEIKQLQVNQDTQLKAAFGLYAEGEDLENKMYDVNLTVIAATYAKRSLDITGSVGVNIPQGHSLFTVVTDANGNTLEFTTDTALAFIGTETKAVTITAKLAGTAGNFATGAQFILSPSIPGISLIVDNGVTVAARNEETDEEARERYLFKRRNPDTGGNKNDYIRWALEVAGVGKAKCIPRSNGNGTVKVLLVGADFLPAAALVVTAAQDYLDPGALGLGDGKAPANAAVTAAAAIGITVDVVVTGLTVMVGYDVPGVTAAFEDELAAYLRELVFVEGAKVSYKRISALLTFTEGVEEYTTLTVNGATVDIILGAEDVPVMGQVTT